MLIMSDKQCKAAGIESLNQRCTYCSKALHAYPLIMGDDAQHSVYLPAPSNWQQTSC